MHCGSVVMLNWYLYVASDAYSYLQSARIHLYTSVVILHCPTRQAMLLYDGFVFGCDACFLDPFFIDARVLTIFIELTCEEI